MHYSLLQLPSKALTDLSALSGTVNELLVQQQKIRKRRSKTHGGVITQGIKSSSTPAQGTLRKFGHGVGTLKARTLIM